MQILAFTADNLDSNTKVIRLIDPSFRHLIKLVHEGESVHNVALKEIAYYLIILKNMSENSTEILLKIYKKYSIDNKLMESIISIHKSCASAFIQDRITEFIKEQGKRFPEILSRESAIAGALPYLSTKDKVKILFLSKYYYKKLRNRVLEQILQEPQILQQNRVIIYKQIIPARFKVQFVVGTKDCHLNDDNKQIIKLDLHRTCKNDSQLYEQIENLLYNFVQDNELSTGYFQGLNFVCQYVSVMMADQVWSLSFLKYIAEYIFNNYFNCIKYKQGEGMMILIFICERLIKINTPEVFQHMQRKGINCQQFSTSPLITLFTWQFKVQAKGMTPMMDLIWDSIVIVVLTLTQKPDWTTVMSIFLYIIYCIQDFILVCEMEDFLIFWDFLFSSQEFWQLTPLDLNKLEGRISQSKLDTVQVTSLCIRLGQLKTGIKRMIVNEEIMDLLHQEYQSNHNNIVTVLNNLTELVDNGEEF